MCLTPFRVACRLAARRLDASQYVEHRVEAAQAPMLPVHPTSRATVAVEFPNISLGLKPRGKPPKLALYHSLDTRRIIKRCGLLVPCFCSAVVLANAIGGAATAERGALAEIPVFGMQASEAAPGTAHAGPTAGGAAQGHAITGRHPATC